MSEQNLTSALDMPLGFYGKLPSLGDFVSRRLSQDFIAPWDSWLQSSIATSSEILADQWLKSYLTSPIWRFALSPGILGKDAWIGIVMPSVDRVGRYFPLTIASKVTSTEPLIQLFSAACDWFEELESIALSALENNLAVEAFDEMVKSIAPLEINVGNDANFKRNERQPEENAAFYLEFENPDIKTDQVFSDLSSLFLDTYLPLHSLWSSVGSEDMKPGFLVVNGLPPFTGYAGMITGQFQKSGWELHQHQISQSTTKIQNEILHHDNSIKKNDENAPSKIPDLKGSAISSTPEQRAMQDTWQSFSRTDTGKVRKCNEDSILDRPDLGLWVVADGMGGHQAGDVASRKIINTLNKLNPSPSLELAIAEVTAALQLVHHEIKELSARVYDQQIIGSTVVALVAGKTHFAYLWAGDSRLYRLRDKKLLQLTIDHCSEQEEMTDVLNLGSNNETKQNNVITRAVGAYEELDLDCQVVDIQSGDIFLLSSDGLDKEVSFQEIKQVLAENNYSESVEILLEQVLKRGARDNASVIVIEIK